MLLNFGGGRADLSSVLLSILKKADAPKLFSVVGCGLLLILSFC